METLHALRGHRTIILVTHSLKAAAGCDVIFVLDRGQIAEQGSHDSLLAQSGLYATMFTVPHLHVEQEEIGEAA